MKLQLVISSVVFSASIAIAAQSFQSQNQIREKTDSPYFKECIDDSDCSSLGHKYACFKYMCYPWKDDAEVPPEHRISTCRSDDECDVEQECYRHPDRRVVSRGLCFDEMENNGECSKDTECNQAKGYACCSFHCCPMVYREKYQQLPCVTDMGCEDLNLGKYCCPRTGNLTSVCCDLNPHPPTTPIPEPSVGQASQLITSGLILGLAWISLRFFR